MSYDTSLSLLQQLRSVQDQESWRRFFAIYNPLLKNWLRQRGVSEEVSDDVCQEVMSKVLQELPNFSHNGRAGAFRTWLRNILVHRLRTVLRRRWREPHLAPPAWVDLADQLGTHDSTLTRAWNEEHDAYLVARLIELVAPEFQEKSLAAFLQVVIEQRDLQAVARDLNMSVNAVRIAQSRILAALRRVGAGIID